MACPGTYPTVLNGKMYFNSSTTVEFECLSGFAMSGNKVITCSGSVATWTDAPTCSAITDDDEVFPEWWLVVAAIVLVLLVLACCLCILCYFCCGRGGGDNAVHPYSRHNNSNCCDGCCRSNGCCRGCSNGCGSNGCCGGRCGSGSCCRFGSSGGCCSCCADGGESGTGGDSSNGGGRGGGGGGDGKGGYQTVHHTEGPNGQKGVYFVPVNSMPSEAPGYYVFKVDGDGAMKTGQGNSTGKGSTTNKTSYSSGYGATSTGSQKPASTANNALGSKDSKEWKDSSNYQARGDGEMMDYSNNTPRPLKPAKEVKDWLPHSNPVRNTHNTSTK
ncbi:uncharacterized protein [Littorina saxatilis]|uniref:Sushi domain-containing protein n=1 Tax=Littorina saxatilis TaxID=31220 RepID=A0AAN9GCJ4_9CAEN